MPIGAYYGPIDTYTKDRWDGFTTTNFLHDKYFKIIADCGINIITTVDCDYADEPENFIKTMELCEKHGLRIFVKDRALETLEGEEAIRERLSAYNHYKCFAGIRIIDEPESYTYPENTDSPNRELSFYCKVAAKLNGIDGLLGYLNLFPYYDGLGGKAFSDYEEYVNTYSENVPTLKLLSWDHYVFEPKSTRYDVYFRNMSLFRELSKKRNVPFWAFVQAGGQWNRNLQTSVPYYPSDGQHAWNINTCLAMGAKGIQYYPLVQPPYDALDENGKIEPNRNGIIGADGSITRWFYRAKRNNAQIRAVDEYLMNAEHIGILPVGDLAVEHTADVDCVLSGTFRELTGVEARRGALLGCFDYKGKTALYVVNYAQEEAQEVTLRFDKSCAFKTVCADGIEEGTGTTCTIPLEDGGAKLVLIG